MDCWALEKYPSAGAGSLRAMLMADDILALAPARIQLALADGDMTALEEAEGELPTDANGKVQLRQVMDMINTTGWDWTLLTEEEIDSLYAYAESGITNAAYYGGLLHAYHGIEVEVEPRFPSMERSMAWSDPANEDGTLMELTAYPSPADDETMLTYPVEWKGQTLVMEDNQGKVVLRILLAGNGVQQLPTLALADGVYSIRVPEVGRGGRLLVQHR